MSIIKKALQRLNDPSVSIEKLARWIQDQPDLRGILEAEEVETEAGISLVFSATEPGGEKAVLIAIIWEAVKLSSADDIAALNRKPWKLRGNQAYRVFVDRRKAARQTMVGIIERWSIDNDSDETRWKLLTTKVWAAELDVDNRTITRWWNENQPWIKKESHGNYWINTKHRFIATEGWKKALPEK